MGCNATRLRPASTGFRSARTAASCSKRSGLAPALPSLSAWLERLRQFLDEVRHHLCIE